MTTDVDQSVLVETCSLDVHPGEPITADRLLRRLDVLRQRLAVRWCGSTGAFAGYDELRMTNQGIVTEGTVHFEARMVDATEKSHTVELSATLSSDDTVRDETPPTLVAIGRGRTLHVTCVDASC